MHEAEQLQANATAKLRRHEVLLGGQHVARVEVRDYCVMAFVDTDNRA